MTRRAIESPISGIKCLILKAELLSFICMLFLRWREEGEADGHCIHSRVLPNAMDEPFGP